MSPQAPALPPDLQQLQREKPVTEVNSHFTDKTSQSGDDKKDRPDHPSRGSSVTSYRSAESHKLTDARKSSTEESEASQSQHKGESVGAADSQQEDLMNVRKSQASVKQESQGVMDLKTGKDEEYSQNEREQAGGNVSGESQQSTTSSKHTTPSVGRQQSEQVATPDEMSARHSVWSSVEKTSDESEPPANSQVMYSDDDDGHVSQHHSSENNSDTNDIITGEPTEDSPGDNDAYHDSEVDTSVDHQNNMTQPASRTNDEV